MKAVYIGAGLDMIPLLFTNYDEFILVDSLPNEEYPNIEFERNLINKMENNDFLFVKQDKESCKYIFRNDKLNKVVNYFYSHSFPESSNKFLDNSLSNFDALIVCNFIPKKDIMNFAKPTIHFIGCTESLYLCEYDDKEQYIDWYLEENMNRVNKFTLLIKKCNDLVNDNIFIDSKEFDFYPDFLDYWDYVTNS
jgi:hypothetical protein